MTSLRDRYKKSTLSIQTKIIVIFLVSTALMFLINLYVNININRVIPRIDKVFESNKALNEVQNGLRNIQNDMTEYLNSKTTSAMQNFYADVSKYKSSLEKLNDEEADTGNIYNISQEYIEISENAVNYGRGYQVKKYEACYEQATDIYTYLDDIIYNLNNKHFENNSAIYGDLVALLKSDQAYNHTIYVLTAILTVILIVFFTKTISRPLTELSEAANQVAKGNFELEPVSIYSRDEVGVVTETFNEMVTSIKAYIEKLKESIEAENLSKKRELEMENSLKDAELKYLQAQINPHFLFNTMNAGAQLSMLEGADRTYEYLQNASNYFRYSVNKGRSYASLKDEIELVDNYIYIINVRYGGDIHYDKIIDEELTDIVLPVMILQPLVENAVNHGIRGIDREGHILLSVYKEDNDIIISVKDNGMGITKEKMKDIIKGRCSESDDSDSNGVGLDNVKNRLNLFYGEKDILHIMSDGEDQGTEVIIRLSKKDRERKIKHV